MKRKNNWLLPLIGIIVVITIIVFIAFLISNGFKLI